MADYKELLRRAIEALAESNGAARRQVYEKARSALVAQLRAIQPPLPAREITQHRLKLEDCIRQVEQEATEALLNSSPPPPSMPPAVASPPVNADERAERAIAKALVADRMPPPDPKPQMRPAANAPEKKPAPRDAAPVPKQKAAGAPPAATVRPPAAETFHPAPAPTLTPRKARPAPQPPIMVVRQPEPEAEPMDEPAGEADDEAPRQPGPLSIEQVIAAAQRDSAMPRTETPPSQGNRPTGKPVVRPAVRIEQEPRRRAAAAEGVARRENAIARAEPGRQMGLEAAISAAMSSVREVEVDPGPGRKQARDAAEVDDNPQASIDRAIAALDREVKGAVAEESPAISAAVKQREVKERRVVADRSRPAAADEHPPAGGDDYWSEADAAQFEAGHEEFENTPMEDGEPAGRGGFTIFLVMVVVLLVAAGGGGFWAWREGYLDLGGLMTRIGIGGQTQTAAGPADTATLAPAVDEPVAEANTEPAGNTTQLPSDSALPANGAGIEGSPKIDERLPVEGAVRVVEPEGAGNTEAAPGVEGEATATEVAPTEGEGATAAPAGEALIDPALVEGNQSILLEEQGAGANGPAPFSGTVDWTRDVDELGLPVIRATARIPARNLSVDLLFRKNSDAALPASHLVEINFSVLDSFVGGGIATLPGVMFKNEELSQGTPLAGASARVFDNQFLFALSAETVDLASNATLMRSQAWIDLLMVYSTGRRAIMTLEKGEDGQAIFDAVLDAWAAEN